MEQFQVERNRSYELKSCRNQKLSISLHRIWDTSAKQKVLTNKKQKDYAERTEHRNPAESD